MFKKLREKIVEEVRQSPIRFPGNDPFQTISLDDSPKKAENQCPKPEQFSIADDDGTSSELGSPCKDQNNASAHGQPNEKQAEMASELPSHESDHFLFQYQAPQWPNYVPQSDIESEVDDGQTSNLDGVSKEQLYTAAQKLHARLQKYKTKYTEVVKAYKDINDEKEKIKRALTDSQDKALRRMTELREQCSLEQQAKAHLEQNLRVMLEEKDEIIGVLETKIQLLKDGGSIAETNSEVSKEVTVVDNLVDLGTSSPDSQAADLQEMQKKVKRLEELLGRCKETLRSNKERSTLLMQERDHLASQLEQKEKEILQVQEKELEVQARLRGELSEIREQMKHLEKQQEESVMAMAETKQNMHQELESREQQLAKVKEELQSLLNEKENLEKTMEQKEIDVKNAKDEKEIAVKEVQDELQRTVSTLEEEKQSLMQELARGKTAAIALVQEESGKMLEQKEQEWQTLLNETEQKLSSEHEAKLAEIRSQCQQQIEDAAKAVREMKDKEKKFKSELSKTKVQLQQHQAEVTAMKTKQEETIQRSEQEKHAINQIEMKLQTLLGEKDKELVHLSGVKDNLQQQLTDSCQKTEHLEKELGCLRIELQETKAKGEGNETELSSALNAEKRKTDTLHKEINSLSEQLRSLETSNYSSNELRKQHEVLSRENENNILQLQAEKELVTKLEAEIDVLKANRVHLEQSCDENGTKLKLLEQELTEKDSEIGKFHQDIARLRDSQKGFRDSNCNHLQRTSLLRQELDSLKSICLNIREDADNQISVIFETVTKLQMENEVQAKRLKLVESVNKNLENEVQLKKKEVEELQLSLSVMEQQKNNVKQEIELNESKKLLKFLEKNSEHYNGYLKHFDEKIAGAISVRHDQLQNLQGILLQLKSNLNSSHKQKETTIEELRNEIQTKDVEIEELKMRVASMEVESCELSNSLEEKTRWQKEVRQKLEDQISDVINKSQVWKQKVQQSQEQMEMERITFEEQIKGMEHDHSKRLSLLSEEIESQKKSSNELTELLKVAEEQIANLEASSRDWEGKFRGLQEENEKIVTRLSEDQDSSNKSQEELKNKMLEFERLCQDKETNINRKCQENEILQKALAASDSKLTEITEQINLQDEQNMTAIHKCNEDWEQRLSSTVKDKNNELRDLEESFRVQLAEEGDKMSVCIRQLTDMEEELKKRDLALIELQDVEASKQQCISELEVLKEDLSKKEIEISEYSMAVTAKDALLQSLSGQLEQLQNSVQDAEILEQRCKEKEIKVAELEETLGRLQEDRRYVIQELEEKLANSVSEFESNQIKIQQLQELIANNTMQTSEEMDDRLTFDMEEEISRLRDELEDAHTKKRALEESEASIKSDHSFLEEQMKVMQENHNKKIAELKIELELVSAQLDESLLVAEGNQASSSSEMGSMKNQLEELRKELDQKNQELGTAAGRTSPSQNTSGTDSEMSDETRTKNQEKEDQLLWENRQIRENLESEVAEKANALDEMRDYFQQQLQEKEEEINKLKESERKKSKVEASDWDNGWEVEPVEDELYALDKENQKSATEEMQDSISKYQKEVAELRRLLMLKDHRSSIQDLSNGAQHLADTFLQPTEYEYLRNIMLEYMMGKEPLTLAKVISAVLRFTDDQTQQILMREEARQPSVK